MKSQTQLHGCNPLDKFANQERKQSRPEKPPYVCAKCGKRFRNPLIRIEHQQQCKE